MKIDAPLLSDSLAGAAESARARAELGFDGLFTFDGPHEPFLPLAMAAEHTRCDLMTAVAVAFARSPMITAQLAQELACACDGRFLLGIGSQIRPHIERRFSMPWSRPVARMKDYVGALRAIFACWNHDEPLAYEGDFYRFSLMPPIMKPQAAPGGAPPILVAGVGAAMLKAAGEVADGCVIHPFHSARYLETVALPALSAGRSAGTRGSDPFAIAVQALVVSGSDDFELDLARSAVRHQIAFYASTPAYLPVLEAEGWSEAQPELRRLTKEGRWGDIGPLVTDAMIERYAVVGDPGQAGRELARRYAGIAARVAVATPLPLSSACLGAIVDGFRSAA